MSEVFMNRVHIKKALNKINHDSSGTAGIMHEN